MFQIDEPGAPTTQPAIPAAGTPGWYQEGDAAAGKAPIAIRGWWLNMVQAELLGLLKAAGLVPSKSVQTQVAQSIQLLGTRQLFIPNAAAANNNAVWTVPAGIFLVRAVGRGPGGPGGFGSSYSGGITSGGAGGGGGFFDVFIPVQPGQSLLLQVGAALPVGSSQSTTPAETSVSANGQQLAIAFGAPAAGNASGGAPGAGGPGAAGGITTAGGTAGVYGETRGGGGGTYGIYTSGTACMSIAGTAWGTTNPVVSSGGVNPGEQGGAAGGGGTGGIGLTSGGVAGQPGGAGADGELRLYW